MGEDVLSVRRVGDLDDEAEWRREMSDANIARLIDGIREQLAELHSSEEDVRRLLTSEPRIGSLKLKARGFKHDERIVRDQRLRQLGTALDAAYRVHAVVSDAARLDQLSPADWLAVQQDTASAYAYVALPAITQYKSKQRGRRLGGHAKAGSEHSEHYAWKEMAVQLRRRNHRRTDLSCARAIVAGTELSQREENRWSVAEVRRGLTCRECPDPPGRKRQH